MIGANTMANPTAMTGKKLGDPAIQAGLRAPFAPGAEQYKPGPTWDEDGVKWTKPLAYIDARAVFDRLDEVVGADGWESRLKEIRPGAWLCELTVLGVTKSDVGQAGDDEGEKDKSGASDAIKRAAVQFGVGRYLYDRELPRVAMQQRRNGKWFIPEGWRPQGGRQASVAVLHGGKSEANSQTQDVTQEAPPQATVKKDDPVGINQKTSYPSEMATEKQQGKIMAEWIRVFGNQHHDLTALAARDHLEQKTGVRHTQQLTRSGASSYIDVLMAMPAKVEG